MIEGGEYLLSLDPTQWLPTWTAQDSIYDPRSNTWTRARTREPEDTPHPTIASFPDRVHGGESHSTDGFDLDRVSQGAAHADDVQGATNYPRVRTTNNATGHVGCARTHDPGNTAIALSHLVSTQFDGPPGVERGSSTLGIVVNATVAATVPVLV